MIAIITAIYDKYDELKPVYPQTVDTEWIFVTDDPTMEYVDEHLGWKVIYDPRSDVHPNRAAKRPKMLPWHYTNVDQSIWIDASFRVLSPSFAVDVMSYADPIAQFVHPWRQCIYDEAVASALPKYDGEPISQQVDNYRELGHPPHWGLWATGVIARYHTDEVMQFGLDWLEENYIWSFQDQLSHPVSLRRYNLRPNALPGTHMANPWLSYEGSLRH